MQAVLAHGLDMFGPGIDQRDIMSRAGQVTAGNTTDGTGPYDYNAFTHDK
jgi:hypothetical protein